MRERERKRVRASEREREQVSEKTGEKESERNSQKIEKWGGLVLHFPEKSFLRETHRPKRFFGGGAD